MPTLTLYERKRAGPHPGAHRPQPGRSFGLLQPVADGIKLIFKEELIPAKADKLIFILAPIITVVPALIITAVIPWGTRSTCLAGRSPVPRRYQCGGAVRHAITSISVYGIALAGWSSNNKYAMLGGLRSTAQMISYELALGLSFVGPVMLAGSMSLATSSNAQKDYLVHRLPAGRGRLSS